MSAIQTTNTPARKQRSTVAHLFHRALRHLQRNRAINELSRLDNMQLEDIGISRNDIPRIVDGLFNSEEPDARPAPKADDRGKAAVIVADSCRQAA